MTLVRAAESDVGSVAAFRANIRRVAAKGDAAAGELLRMLEDARLRLRDRALSSDAASAAWARAMLREVEAEVRALAERMEPAMRRHFLEVLGDADRDVRDVAEAQAPPGTWLGFAGVDRDLLDFAAQDSADLVRQLTTDLRARLNRTLRTAATGALPVEEVARQIGGTLETAARPEGVFGRLATQVERVMRTETGRLYEGSSAARAERIEADSGLVAEKGWIAALDDRTRDSHRALNGTWIARNEKFDVNGYPADGPLDPALPAAEAVNCRCSLGYRFRESAA